ncbi:hypothetical protein QWY82_17320 [Simiduia curdlanivorans]|uniref:Uncharacterized protein n=1 Tax=Simiduia curdlanivorans TaxID=1492769 RepID=A0ABV8V4R8_9GAMM|nr:hypothetical protein [Simiduia curdlanivorans]MDN3640561.1 hypothetical protein [Simiduia curdlanivorans]
MMNWTTRYLQALAPYLPQQQRQDICDELEANLLDRLEERARENGSEDTESDAKALIAELGHPARYASEFHTRQALISQPLLEIYKQTLRWLVWILVGLFSAIELVASLYSGDIHPIAMAFSIANNIVEHLVWGFSIITLVFYFAEAQINKLSLLERWQPEDLPLLQPAWNKVSASESAFGVVTYTLFAAWMFGWIAPFNTWRLALGNTLAADLYAWLIPAIGLLAIAFALHRLYLCFLPYWQRSSLACNIALNVATLAAVALLITLPSDQLPIFISDKVEVQALLDHLSYSVKWMLLVIAGFSLYEITRDGLRWRQVP